MKLLVDADYIVYKSCAGAESEIDWGDDVIVVTSKFSEAYNNTKREIKKIENAFFLVLILFCSLVIVSISGSLFLSPTKDTETERKPCGYRRVIEALKEEYEVIRMDTLEADDAMGIYATLYPGNTIVSPDKDMRQIPGNLYDLNEVTVVIP